jgi:hypothetical protein
MVTQCAELVIALLEFVGECPQVAGALFRRQLGTA